jgi:RimJ/RimL family protein N-acetyltransferase
MSITLRPFAAQDDDLLISWFANADELRLFAGNSLRWPLDRRQLEAIRAELNVVAWTAVEIATAEVVGHIELARLTDRRWGRLSRVAIAPERRGEGFGRALVTAALDEAARAGMTGVDLRVYAVNAAARATYVAVGFSDVGADRIEPELLWMVKRI